MSDNTAAAAHETTRLLSPADRHDCSNAAPFVSDSSCDAARVEVADDATGRHMQQTWLDSTTKRALIAVFVANLMVSFAHYVAISSIMDLIRGLSCQEYYSLRPNQFGQPGVERDCSLVDIQDRTSMVFSYMLSINSFISCLSALWLAPWLLRRLGLRLTMIIAVLAPTVELFVLASVPNRFPQNHGWIGSPTASLRFLLLESLLFGLVGCPDTLIGIVSQSIVLDASPPPLRSTWLARLSSCTFLGMLASTLLLSTLSLDTSRDDVSDKLPILLAALISTAAIFWTCLALPTHLPINGAQKDATARSTNVQESQSTGQSLKARLGQVMQPLRLLKPIEIYDETQDSAPPHAPSRPTRDWRLPKLIIAATLCDQIAVTTNLQVIYVQTRFGLHAQDLSRLLGLVGLIKWVYLVLVSTDKLVATLSSLANIMSTIGPILNANLYRFGLKRGFPEIVFAMAAAISVAVAVLVAGTRPSMRSCSV
ncbi:hypothetical protein EX895_001878 [Sporisorium graminicola]|uniref:Major facilitator superfamily (MFS) profile domain-containing protein n=1 Tax=Sporisorium graminicola TaxID=280036 RepID=A0A4U7KYJ9_9BASI|nr:hypothetical protein EX895_001878 [Sporisorium graminicola]TKY89347.1 hypothetical protein EX895_001878 [Sporisorium graminicola]